MRRNFMSIQFSMNEAETRNFMNEMSRALLLQNLPLKIRLLLRPFSHMCASNKDETELPSNLSHNCQQMCLRGQILTTRRWFRFCSQGGWCHGRFRAQNEKLKAERNWNRVDKTLTHSQRSLSYMSIELVGILAPKPTRSSLIRKKNFRLQWFVPHMTFRPTQSNSTLLSRDSMEFFSWKWILCWI